MRSDTCGVAPLVGVGKRDEKGFAGFADTVTGYVVGLCLVREHEVYDVLQIRHESALRAVCKPVSHFGVQACSAGAYKELFVSQPVVDVNRSAIVQQCDGFACIHGNMQVSRQTVAAAHRQDSQCGSGVA